MKENPLYEAERIKAIAYFDEKDVRDKIEKDKEKRKKRKKALMNLIAYIIIFISLYVMFNRIFGSIL